MKRTALLRRTALNKVSKKRRVQWKTYSEKRIDFLADHPTCQNCLRKKSVDIHHKEGRIGTAYLDEKTWAALCRFCHDWIHQHPREAREQGWLKT